MSKSAIIHSMSTSFVDVQDISFAAAPPQGLWSRWSGRKAKTQPILQNVTFSLNQGQWVTLYGAPGAGKTTLLHLLAGLVKPTHGSITVNGAMPWQAKNGVISGDTISLARLSSTERLQKSIEQAAQSDVPLILLDDIVEQLGTDMVKRLLFEKFQHRTVIISTRFPAAAEALNLPILLLHHGQLACSGTCDEIATRLNTPRVLDAWIEGIRYDIFRSLKQHPGVAEVILLPDGRFHGQRLRITLKSSRYLPALYDMVSRLPLIRLEEQPVHLNDILSRL